MMTFEFDGSFGGWRAAARSALQRGMPPDAVAWSDGEEDQVALEFGMQTAAGALVAATTPAATARVSREFLELAAQVACHRDAGRWALCYRLLWRHTRGEPEVLERTTDPDVNRFHAYARAVRHDEHRMHAFVRFRETRTEEGPLFIAWYEPEHRIVERAAPFFHDRFATMRWSILTPDRCVHWDLSTLHVMPGVPGAGRRAEDDTEELWRTYYASTFNPARAKPASLAAHLPARFRPNLPEAGIIPELLARSRGRAELMVAESAAGQLAAERYGVAPVPATRDLAALRTAASHCRACPLWRKATCTVFGEGPERARIVVVGEQPGDQEDRAGRTFIGPAGQLLDRAFSAAGVERASLYITGAVKHFKWVPRGKRRLHQRPGAREIAACRPWLEAELAAIRPELIVCLGTTAAQSILERPVQVTRERGQRFETEFGAPALITLHPSALLRLPPERDPVREFQAFVDELKQIAAHGINGPRAGR